MHAFKVISALVLMTAAAVGAQQSATPLPLQTIKTFTSSSDVAALIAKAKADRKEGQATVSEPILQLAPYKANLEYWVSAGLFGVHEREAEVFYVIDGAATIVTGGKLVDEVRRSNGNLTGTAIEGGMSQKIAKGDFFVVPENTPHGFGTIDGAIVLMTLHVPRPVAPAQ